MTDEEAGAQRGELLAAGPTANQKREPRPATGTQSPPFPLAQSLPGLDAGTVSSEPPGVRESRSRWKISWESTSRGPPRNTRERLNVVISIFWKEMK